MCAWSLVPLEARRSALLCSFQIPEMHSRKARACAESLAQARGWRLTANRKSHFGS